MPEPVLVAVAHGSVDPRAAATVRDLMTVTAERAAARGLVLPDLRAAYLGHAAPSLSQVMNAIGVEGPQGPEGLKGPGRVTVLPLLLTAAYHSKTDLPRMVARVREELPRLRVSYGGTLGPHPLLLRALERRLAETDPEAAWRLRDPAGRGNRADRARTGVVLAAAGSTDRDANATVSRLAARWQARRGWFAVRPAYAAATAPGAQTPPAAVTGLLRAGAHRVLVATYLLAPGVFADRIRDASLSAGAAAVAPALGALPEVADVLLDRYEEAGSQLRTAA
jgi:sirohydrochlorin ferrochelatase